MYESFFGLQQEPFSIAPDPRFLYLSDKHREALALLNHGLSRGASFVLLTGEIGAGKTTVWRAFLGQLPSNVDVASVVNPKLDVTALLARVCEDLQVPLPESGRPVDLIDTLHGHLLLAHAQGRRTLIVIDEAQALSPDVLEQLRLLTNLDSTGRKLQVLLIGQPELRQILERPQLEPVAQRVVARYHLPALSAAETVAYIEHRLRIAGLAGAIPFDGDALAAIHRLCHGVPRRINVLCERALIGAFTRGQRLVDAAVVERAAAETFGERLPPPRSPASPAPRSAAPWLAVAAVAAAVGAGAVMVVQRSGPSPASSPAPAPAAAPVTATATPEAAKPAASVPAAAPAPTRVAVPAEAIPLPSLDAAFDPASADEAAGWRALASLWGVTLGPGDPCAAAALQSLQCFRGRGGLPLLRQLDRPGLLRLVDDRGRVAHVIVTGIGDGGVKLIVAGVERRVTDAALAALWRGDFATLWRSPPGYRDGEGGASGRWLAERLAAIDRQPPLPGTDEGLRARVYAFQIASGLAPDGVAGPLTVMQLNRASGVPEPRLKPGGS